MVEKGDEDGVKELVVGFKRLCACILTFLTWLQETLTLERHHRNLHTCTYENMIKLPVERLAEL